METQLFTKTVRHDTRRADVEKGVKKLNTLVRRHGGEVRVVSATTESVKRNWFDGDQRMIAATTYVIEAPVVAGEGGKLVGTFELAEDGKQVYANAAPGFCEADLDPFRARHQDCDHCNTKRARLASFVVEREDGTRLVVGRNCSRAFMGLSFEALTAALGVAVSLREEDEDGGFWGGGEPTFDTVTVLNNAWVVAKHFGGYSAELRDDLRGAFWLLTRPPRDLSDDAVKFTRALKATAASVGKLDLEAFSAYLEGAGGDFGNNLRISCSMERVRDKRVGILLAGVGLYVGRAMKRELAAQATKDAPAPRHVAASEKARVDVTLACVRTVPIQSDFGSKTLCIFRGEDGQSAIWWATAQDVPEAGKTYALRGTVKKHDFNRRTQEPETVLQRCTFKEVAAAAVLEAA